MPNWTQVFRFPPGSRLRLTPALSPPLRTAIEKADTRAAQWLTVLEQATLQITHLDETRCELQAHAQTTTLALTLTQGTANATLTHEGTEHTRHYTDLATMLAGRHEALIARRTETGTTPYLRLTYTPLSPTADLALYTTAFTQRLPTAVRALLPALVTIGRLGVE